MNSAASHVHVWPVLLCGLWLIQKCMCYDSTSLPAGWQPRWFVLAGGVLSYYASEEEVDLGCRGSCALATAEIHVKPSDDCAFEILLENGQRLYVKAANAR